MTDWDRIRTLMLQVARHGPGDWQELLVALEQPLLHIARRQRLGRLRDREDTPREIVTRVLSRLAANDYRALERMAQRDPLPHPRAWLRVITRHAAVDYMREQSEFVRGSADREDRWVSLVSLITGAGGADPDTLAQKRRQAIAFLADSVQAATTMHTEVGDGAFERLAATWHVAKIHVRRLVKKGGQCVEVFVSFLEGLTQVEVAERLGLTPRQVQLDLKHVREFLEARRFGQA